MGYGRHAAKKNYFTLLSEYNRRRQSRRRPARAEVNSNNLNHWRQYGIDFWFWQEIASRAIIPCLKSRVQTASACLPKATTLKE